MNKNQKAVHKLNQLLQFDIEFRNQGYHYPAGIDEAGRGPLAGPVVAAAVILPKDWKMEGIDDSKKLTAKQRELCYPEIIKNAVSYGIGCISENLIDEVNILQATYLAMKQAVDNLSVKPDFLLVDGSSIPDCFYPQIAIVKGDGKSLTIASASILAKVTRDNMMRKYDTDYPLYGFAKHKGYGTRSHYQALQNYGPCPIHRKSFIHHSGTRVFI